MQIQETVSKTLTSQDFEKIKQLSVKHYYKQGDLIFSDGDTADHIYFIDSGQVTIFIEKFTKKEEITTLGAGEIFGEMAFFSGGKRSASAAALVDSTLLRTDKSAFMHLLKTDHDIANKINNIFIKRNDELTQKEHLIDNSTVDKGENVRIGIKGDPSIRETAFYRERYDSVVDRIISDLQPRLFDLLLNRVAFEIFVHCNSGEVRVRSVFDPFNDEIHPASKLLNIAYIQRHFPLIDYTEKAIMVKRLYGFIAEHTGVENLPVQFREGISTKSTNWEPVQPREIARTVSKLSMLRKIPNFYLRNFTISMIRDAIRVQFNCDGTHIVNSQGLQTLIEENLGEQEIAPFKERRVAQLRGVTQHEKTLRASGDRRGSPGRRHADWSAMCK